MPGKGKHRRPKTSTLTRGFVAAGTGGDEAAGEGAGLGT
ncbi:peptidase, partial [Streptomyces solincola]